MRRFVFVLLLLAGIVALFGCAQVRDENRTKPWPPPESWERNVEIGPFSPQ